MRHSADYGIARADFTLDFAQVMERVAGVVREVEPHGMCAEVEIPARVALA